MQNRQEYQLPAFTRESPALFQSSEKKARALVLGFNVFHYLDVMSLHIIKRRGNIIDMMVEKMVDMRGGEKVMKQTRKDRELIAAEKARQDSEMHRLYAAFLENSELGIDEAEELLKNVKNVKKAKNAENAKKSKCCSCSKNIKGSVGEKQDAEDRKKVVKNGRWRRLKNLALCFDLCLLECVNWNGA